MAGHFADGVYGRHIGRVIGVGVGHGERRFAEHVIGIGVAFCLHGAGAIHRLANGAPEHELAAQFAHGLLDCRADHRLAQPLDRAMHDRCETARRRLAQHRTGQHQRPGGGIHQRRGGLAKMLAPGGRRDLVLDQRVHGLGVGHSEQRLGEAHQRDALIGRKPIFRQEHLHHAGRVHGADIADECGGAGMGGIAQASVDGCSCSHRGQRIGFIGQVRGGDPLAQQNGIVESAGHAACYLVSRRHVACLSLMKRQSD